MRAIFNTQHGIYRTVDRLAYYRKQAETAPQQMHSHYADWRAWRSRSLWGTPNTVRTKEGAILSDSLDQYGADLGAVHELMRKHGRRFDSRGYFIDGFYDDTITGHVVKLRCPRGTLYIPATMCSGWDGTIHYINDCQLVPKGASEEEHEEAIIQACRDADHYAEKEAEDACEDSAKQQAEHDIEQARESIHETNKQALALIKEIKQHGEFSPAVCSALRSTLSGYLHERKRQFRLIATRQANYWSAVNC